MNCNLSTSAIVGFMALGCTGFATLDHPDLSEHETSWNWSLLFGGVCPVIIEYLLNSISTYWVYRCCRNINSIQIPMVLSSPSSPATKTHACHAPGRSLFSETSRCNKRCTKISRASAASRCQQLDGCGLCVAQVEKFRACVLKDGKKRGV